MADTAEFVTTIKVRDLISAFESKNELVRVEFSRPRAKSVGNVLAKDVLVRQNDFNTLEDVEKALRKLNGNLNFYQVYNKEKHVSFQEQLFNILTSIVNIESDGEDSSAKKKHLIGQTQTLVSFLNQKLPSNISQGVSSPPVQQYTYTTYSSYVKENGTAESKSTVDGSGKKYAPFSQTTKSIDVTDFTKDSAISVRKLKESFQPKIEIEADSLSNTDKKFKTEYTINMSDTDASTGYNQEQQPRVKTQKHEDRVENVSVPKLRSLFEQKPGDGAKGLEIITDDKPPNIVFENFTNTANFPYTERNLGNLRMQRSASGNYMNYVGLLKRTDINRSKSVQDLNRTNRVKVIKRVTDRSDRDSDVESDKSLDDVEEKENAEVKINQSARSLDNLERISGNRIEEEIPALKRVKEIIVKYSTNTESQVQAVNYRTVEKEESVTTKFLEKPEANSTNKSDDKENIIDYESIDLEKEELPILGSVKEMVEKYSINIEEEIQKPQDKNIEEKSITITEKVDSTPTFAEKEDVIETESNNSETEELPILGSVKEMVEKYSTIIVNNDENSTTVDEKTDLNYSTSISEQKHGEEIENQAIITDTEAAEVNIGAVSDNKENVVENESNNVENEKLPVLGSVKEIVEKYSTNIEAEIQQPKVKNTEEEIKTVTEKTNVNSTSDEDDIIEDDTNNLEREDVYVSGIVKEMMEKYSTNTETEVQHEDTNTEEKSIAVVEETNVGYSTPISVDTNQEAEELQRNVTIGGVQEINIPYLTVETRDIPENENVASVKGIEEINVSFSTATSADIKPSGDLHQENIASIARVEEKEVHVQNAEHVEVPQNENVAVIEGADKPNVKDTPATSGDIRQDNPQEDVSDNEGIKQMELRSQVVESTTDSEKENVSNLIGTNEAPVSSYTAPSDHGNQDRKENATTVKSTQETVVSNSIVENHNDNTANINTTTVEDVIGHTTTYGSIVFEGANHVTDSTDNVSTAATAGSEDYNRDAVFTEEEIDKIDVESTLANDDIILNAEDLKNAEDEFEKLLEKAEKEKTTT